ncbi:hypothetical protein [Massilia sp. BJB1822]|uniref:hypothetical protein n=1 Tax=Massilia sp. BJB1822 TaxID=2744470 RepID=UPI0015946947|nr:hypothetical protein [Massilia sp. BJB1822]NVE00930.1 hypothetical protein [Massilia sp. BJB1822]
MSVKPRPVTPTPFFNVFVVAVPYTNEKGEKVYKTKFTPESLDVSQRDTVINYQLIYPTPEDVIIESVSIKPEHSNQLSEPSIGDSGKLVTFSDANTAEEIFNITLGFADKEGKKFFVDPEISNTPPPG